MNGTSGDIVKQVPHIPAEITLSLPSVSPLILIGAAVLVVVVLLISTWRIVRTMRYLHAQSSEGRRISAEQSGTHPLTNFSRNGKPSDPLNVRIIATGAQLATAFAAAGWYRADEIDFVTSLRISVDAILGRRYPTAPVSNLYLFGRKQDFAFERPGSSVRERDHVRFWDTGKHAKDGRSIWVGGATRDIKVELSPITHLPTHRIAPDVDTERAIVINDLIATGWVIDETWDGGLGRLTQTHNAMGDPYHTDGRVVVLTLANVPVLLPLATQVRGPAASATRIAARALRWTLPRRGRLRAKEQTAKQPSTDEPTAGPPDES